MRVRLALLCVLILPCGVVAQTPGPTPEQLLGADCLLYFRYDGYEAHRQAYDRTALAKSMNEGLGDFLHHVFHQLANFTAGAAVDAKEGPRPNLLLQEVSDYLWKHGFLVGVESSVVGKEDARLQDAFQFNVVFPQGGQARNRQFLEGLLQKAAQAGGIALDKFQEGTRTGFSFTEKGIKVMCWAEGAHLVLAVGANPFQRTVAVAEGRRPNVTSLSWFHQLRDFKRYETDMRGYVNLEAVVERLATDGLEQPGLGKLREYLARRAALGHLGLTGLKDLRVHLGFDGKYQRSTIRLGVAAPAERTGLLRLFSGSVAWTPDKLPALPPDADYVSVRHVDWENIYDYARSTFGLLAIARLFEAGEIRNDFPDFDRILGLDFRRDVLQQLDSTLLMYGAHSEGPFFLGQGYAIKVKDAAKVRKGLAAAMEVLGGIDEMLAVRRRNYRGTELHVFANSPLPVTFAVHGDWLLLGLYPQPVQGFILRGGGKYRRWKAPPEMFEALAREKEKSKLLAVSVSDPRPAMEMGLALLPSLASFMASPSIIDVDKIPHAQAVNEWLFPNVGLFYDDGTALRWENHYSINEPDDLLLALPFVGGLVPWGGVPFGLPNQRWKVEAAAAPPGVVPAAPVAPLAADAVPPPPPFPAPETAVAKKPALSKARAYERDREVFLDVVKTEQAAYTVTRMRRGAFVDANGQAFDSAGPGRRFQEGAVVRNQVTKDGMSKTVVSNVIAPVYETNIKAVKTHRTHKLDGKRIEVRRKSGQSVPVAGVLKLLAKDQDVLVVEVDSVPAAILESFDEQILIVHLRPDKK